MTIVLMDSVRYTEEVRSRCVAYYEGGGAHYAATPVYAGSAGFITSEEYEAFRILPVEEKEALREMFLVILLLELGESI